VEDESMIKETALTREEFEERGLNTILDDAWIHYFREGMPIQKTIAIAIASAFNKGVNYQYSDALILKTPLWETIKQHSSACLCDADKEQNRVQNRHRTLATKTEQERLQIDQCGNVRKISLRKLRKILKEANL
jgi:hypothetical protein